MPLGLKDKKAIVAEVNEVAQNALSAVVANYCGLTVDQMTDLRKGAREKGVYVRVVRNKLAIRAIKETDFGCLEEALAGPTVLAFSLEDPGAAARLIKEFSKKYQKLDVKALSINNQLLEASKIDVLAKLPTLDQARAQLMNVMLAPITKLVQTFNEFPLKVTRVVSAVADKKKSDTA